MHWLRHLYRSTQRQSPSIPRPRSRVRLCLEGLETRLAPASVFVVPLGQQSDSTHLHELVAAVNAAGPSGVVTIEPGASPDPVQPVTATQNGLSIQGDPNVPASILPLLALRVDANNVTLTNLNLSSVELSAGRSATSISKCVINDLQERSGTGGHNV